MKGSDTIFSKSEDVRKTFRISIVLLFYLLECPLGIPLDVCPLFTRLELNQDSHTLLCMEQTNVDIAFTSSRFNDDLPASHSEGLHEAPKQNMVNSLRSLVTDGTLRLAD